MYHSCLLIDVGSNPDRPRPGRLWLRNLYRVHQRLCMAFPTPERLENDPQFLGPYDAADFCNVHTERTAERAFLFRIDPRPGGDPVLLVQSGVRPNWDYAFNNARHLLAAPPHTSPFEPRFEAGQNLRFRLKANPTRKVETLSRAERQDKTPGRHGRRVPVGISELDAWLDQRAQSAGFIVRQRLLAQPGYVFVRKEPGSGEGQRLRSVLFEGVLEVTDADRFRDRIVRGIGPAKGFGFGLLSVGPVA